MENINENTVYMMADCTTPEEYWKPDILNESSVMNGDKKVDVITIDACLQSFEVKNWNQRIYGKDVVMEAIDNDGMIQNDIKHGQWLGEYGHPMEDNPKRQVSFDPMKCCHRILSYRTEGNLLLAKVQTLAEGAGSMLCARIKQGVPAAFSLRSLGSIDLATGRVKAPLKVICYDSVIRPSHIEAYQRAVLTESAATNYLQEINNESAMFVPINESYSDILTYIRESSNNIYKIREMFHLDKLDMVLTEDASRVNLILEDGSVINAPVENVLRVQYYDALRSANLRSKKGE